MAQRRSRNRRLSARRSSTGILGDDTNIIDNDDPLWFDKSVIRPSTSFTVTRDATSILTGDSTVNASQVSDSWFQNISQSESSKLIEETVRKNINGRLSNGQTNGNLVEPSTESESEHESQKKRAKFKLSQKSKTNKTSDKSNAFLKVLEKTTDSHTKTVISGHVSDVNDTESNTDDSRTIRKLRPQVFANKKPSRETTKNFDDVLYSDSASEVIETNTQNLRISLKRKSIGNKTDNSVSEKIRKTNINHLDNNGGSFHKSTNKSKDIVIGSPTETLQIKNTDETLVRTPRRSLRNGTIDKTLVELPEIELQNNITDETLVRTPRRSLRNGTIDKTLVESPEIELQNNITNKTMAKSAEKELSKRSNSQTPSKTRTSSRLSQRKSVNTNKQSDESINISTNTTISKLRKQRPLLFSQQNKNTSDKDIFDAVLGTNTDESSNNSNNKTATRKSTKSPEKNGSQRNDENEDQADGSDSESSSIPKNIRRTRSYSMFTQRKPEDESEDENIYEGQNKVGPQKPQNEEDSSSDSDVFSPSKSQAVSIKNHEKALKTSSTEKEKSKSIVNEKSQSQARKRTLSHTVNNSKNVSKATNKSVNDKTNESLEAQKSTNGVNIVNGDNESIEMVNLELSRTKSHEESNSLRTRSHLSKRSKASNEDNVFDKIPSNENSVVNENSKNKTIEKISNASQKSKLSKTLNDSKISSKSIGKSSKNLSLNASSKNNFNVQEKSQNHSQQDENDEEGTRNQSEEDEDEGENSSIPKHIRRTRSRLFERSEHKKSDNAFDNILDVVNTSSQDEEDDTPQKNKSHKKYRSSVNKSSNQSPQSRNSRLSEATKSLKSPGQSTLQENANKKQNNHKSTGPRNSSTKAITNGLSNSISKSRHSNTENASGKKNETLRSSINTSVEASRSVNKSMISIRERSVASDKSVETSSDGSAEVRPNQSKSTNAMHQKTIINGSSGHISDDLLHTPNPAQSTLNPNGKPLTRITQFSLRDNSAIDEEAAASTSTSKSRSLSPATPVPMENVEKDKSASRVQGEEEDVVVDVINDSDQEVSEDPLISRRQEDIPSEEVSEEIQERTTVTKDRSIQKKNATTSFSAKASQKSKKHLNPSTMTEADWAKLKKKTDAMKKKIEERMEEKEKQRREEERKKARIEAQLKRVMAQQEAERRKKQKKPVDRAYYVNGQVYKQPKLPRPKNWATDRLYRFLWKCMEPEYGVRTRVKSEEFVVKLANLVSIIQRRKKYENYRAELEELITMMAKLKIIKTRYDFYRFCSDFMPYSFRIKAVPMQLPGNERNIPFDPELVNKPILEDLGEGADSESSSSESD